VVGAAATLGRTTGVSEISASYVRNGNVTQLPSATTSSLRPAPSIAGDNGAYPRSQAGSCVGEKTAESGPPLMAQRASSAARDAANFLSAETSSGSNAPSVAAACLSAHSFTDSARASLNAAESTLAAESGPADISASRSAVSGTITVEAVLVFSVTALFKASAVWGVGVFPSGSCVVAILDRLQPMKGSTCGVDFRGWYIVGLCSRPFSRIPVKLVKQIFTVPFF